MTERERAWSDREAKLSAEWGLLAGLGKTCECGEDAVDLCGFSSFLVCGAPQCAKHWHKH